MVPSHPDALERLHRLHQWVPGAAHIRPSPAIIEAKYDFMDNLLSVYASLEDHVKEQHFGFRTRPQGLGGLLEAVGMHSGDSTENGTEDRAGVPGRDVDGHVMMHGPRRSFTPNRFPYQQPSARHSTNHWLLWYLWPRQPVDSEGFAATWPGIPESVVTRDIQKEITTLLGHDDFQFVWYENPKPSLASSDLYHVQVFFMDSRF